MSSRLKGKVAKIGNSRLSADLKRIVAEKDPALKSTFVLTAVEECTIEGWPDLNAIDIVGIIKNLIVDPESPNLDESLRAFTTYLNLVLSLEFQDDRNIRTSVVQALESALTICVALWSELDGERDPNPNFVDSLSAFLHSIVQFAANDAYSRYLIKLVRNEHIIYLAMYCVLYAPTNSIEEKADLSRICLASIDTFQYMGAVGSFLYGNHPDFLCEKLRNVIREGTINTGSLMECIVFLDTLHAKHPTQVKLPPDLWKHFILVLRRIVDSDSAGYDIKLLSIYHGNVCFKRYLDDSTDQLSKGQLAKMFSRHDLAELIADIALMVATSWFPGGASNLQRHSLLCCFEKGDRKRTLNVFNEPTIFLVGWFIERLKRPGIRDLLVSGLKPVWHSTLQRMRELDLEEHPGARAVINIWSELGDQISVNLLVDPLVGCTWVGCRLFVQTEDGDDEYMSCAGCVFAQYCDVTCQRRDWKKHKALCTKDHIAK